MERTEVNKLRNERGAVTTNTTEIHRIVRDYYTALKKWTNSQKAQPSKTQPGENEIYEQTNQRY